MKFLRTASSGRLLASIIAIFAVIAGGTAIAVAASGQGPVPKAEPLAQAVHSGLAAPAVTGITADISFTNNLISSGDFTGGPTDPILQGATGRLWLSNDHRMRLELQSSNGDAEILIANGSFWVSDPASGTVYKGTLPAAKAVAKPKTADPAIPTIAQIQSDINRLMKSVNVSAPTPGDVAGQPAYTVSVSPKHSGGLLGSAQLAWDAARGVPLDFAVFARGNTTPVLELKATNISYGAVPASTFKVAPPAGDKVVKVATAGQDKLTAAKTKHAKQAKVSGVAAVAAKVPFTLVAPSTVVGLPRHGVTLLSWGGKPAALVTYGENLGGIAVIEQSPSAASAAKATPSQGSGKGLSLPTVSINGATGQELDTALGTVVRFTRGGVAYTVIGSVPAYAADRAARALAP
jgi:outer membrane lipoprotein-sorting protein